MNNHNSFIRPAVSRIAQAALLLLTAHAVHAQTATTTYHVRVPAKVQCAANAATCTTSSALLGAGPSTEQPETPPSATAPVLSLDKTSLVFGSQLVGVTSSPALRVKVKNTGTAPLTVSGVSVTTGSTDFGRSNDCGSPLAVNAECAVDVAFTPSVAGARAGTVTVISSDNQVATISLSGTGVQAVGALNVASGLDFGSVAVGSPASKTVTFSNSGTATASNVYASVGSAQLTLSNNTCGTAGSPVNLALNSSCSYTVTWTPTAAGALANGSTTVNGTFSGTASANFTGSAFVPQASGALSAATTADFGSLTTGNSVSRTFNFTNSGTVAATGTYVSIPTGMGLSLTANTCGTVGAPVSIAANETCAVTVSWSPTTAGTLAGNVQVISSATNSPNSVAVSGTATNAIASSNGTRTWTDGTVATSCAAYRNPGNGSYTYSGSTGDGIYRIDPDGAGSQSATNVYCDMTSDGGGWTLVLRGVSDISGNSWATTGSIATANATTVNAANSFKFSDSFIQAIPKAAYRLEGYNVVPTGMPNPLIRYAAGTCAYNHTGSPAAGSACAVTFPTLSDLQTNSNNKAVGAPCGHHFGISDSVCNSASAPGYFITQHYPESNTLIVLNNGSDSSAWKSAANGSRLRMWVR